MVQSYVGNPAASKGIAGAYGSFVAFAFGARFLARQRRAFALLD